MALTSFLIESNVDLAPYNTLNIHATARLFSHLTNPHALESLLNDFDCSQQAVFVLGGGSNVLFVNDFDGLIIHVGFSGKKVIKETDDNVWLTVGAGENWHKTVRYCVRQGWGGIENLSLIPGTVGAAPIQNIGAYGVELQDVFEKLTAVEIETGKRRTFYREECAFGYRDSIFKNDLKERFLVTDVTFKLSKKPELNTGYGAIQAKLQERNITKPTVTDISDIVVEIRNSKLPDPSQLANAGSFFKNPVIPLSVFEGLKEKHPSILGYPVNDEHVKVPAGWLIEQTGWKGKEIGHVGTYRQQALVIVNLGGADGREILELSKKIQQSVKEAFNILLVPEVNIVR